MRTMTRAALAALGMIVMACSDDPAGLPPLVVSSVDVTPASPALVVGDTVRLAALPRTADGDVIGGLPVAWESLPAGVVTVSQAGTVKAVAPGTAIVRATVEGKSGDAQVTVVAGAAVVATIEIRALPPELAVGQQVEVEALVRAADGSVVAWPVTWTSANTTTARVQAWIEGPWANVTALAPGNTVIQAEAQGRIAEVAIAVKSLPPVVGFVVVTPGTRNLWQGQSFAFTPVVFSTTGARIPNPPAVAWSVEDASIVQVDAAGNVRGMGVGTTRVFATSGGVRGSAYVKVLKVPGSVLAYGLVPGVDPWGGIQIPVVGTTTWTDGNGTEFPASLVLAAGTLELDRTGPLLWKQTLTIETVVTDTATGTARVVASAKIADHGTFTFTSANGEVFFTLTSAAVPGRVFLGSQTEPGRLALRQAVAGSPLIHWLYEIR